MRKTKIVCTLGPASSDEAVLREMMEAGMNVARFNFSHGTYEEHLARFQLVDRLRQEMGLPIGIMLDTKGPEIRLGNFAQHRVTLGAGDIFTLTTRSVEGDAAQVSISYKDLPRDLRPGCRVLVDDGLIEMVAEEIGETDIRCRVVNGGEISDHKGVNVPDVRLSMPYISQKDYDDLVFGCKTGFDFVAASFARTADDIRQMREVLDTHGGKGIKIIAKIENREGVENLEEILEISDGVMVARGDMGVEIPMEEVPICQKRMIRLAYEAGKHVITATQMLDSMIKNPRPTRAEVNDIANAIYDGTSAIMLSGETAAGKYPVESVRTMARIAQRTEEDINYRRRFYSNENGEHDITNAISHATCTTAYDVEAAAIISVTQLGLTARMCSRFRPSVPILACTPLASTFRQLSMSWGVYPIIMEEQKDTDALFATAVETAKRAGYLKDGDRAVITAGVPLGVPGTTNLLKVTTVGGR